MHKSIGLPPLREAASVGASYLDRIASWLRPETPTAREWSTLTVEDRFRMAADIGVSEPELANAVYRGGDSRELRAVLTRNANRGLAACSLGVLRDMQRVCSLCVERARCREWLARSFDNTAAYPPFCPNADTLASLRKADASRKNQEVSP